MIYRVRCFDWWGDANEVCEKHVNGVAKWQKWAWRSLYLCGAQAYLFNDWQQIGNISGITHWVKEYLNNIKHYWFSERKLKVGNVFSSIKSRIDLIRILLLERRWSDRSVPVKGQPSSVVRKYPVQGICTVIDRILPWLSLCALIWQPVPAMRGTYQTWKNGDDEEYE